MSSLFLFLLLLVVGIEGAGGRRAGPSLEFHHRFSSAVRLWAEARGHAFPGGWPAPGSAACVAALAWHDRGRSLAAGESRPLTFSEGNVTLENNSLGFLHYALVTVGMPGQTFMVALDTGSDLFWLPCQCNGCTPPSSASSQSATFYIPDLSSTSKAVPCNSNFCDLGKDCSEMSQCPYKVVYVSADTSSAGYLFEDVLYLSSEDAHPEILEAQIIFGCGQVQTGSFLGKAAPNGLFGLGMDKMSVPSILSQKGLISDSFSMCFGHDGIGRISFGDQGSLDQAETPLNINQIHPTYNITITGITVGNSQMNLEFSTIFDTGTSFTCLADPAYTYVTQNFHAQFQANRHAADSKIPFEYCYDMSSSDTRIQTPVVSLTTEGRSLFPVNDPGQIISIEQDEHVYCLAILKSTKLNIIGREGFLNLHHGFATLLRPQIHSTTAYDKVLARSHSIEPTGFDKPG